MKDKVAIIGGVGIGLAFVMVSALIFFILSALKTNICYCLLLMVFKKDVKGLCIRARFLMAACEEDCTFFTDILFSAAIKELRCVGRRIKLCLNFFYLFIFFTTQ